MHAFKHILSRELEFYMEKLMLRIFTIYDGEQHINNNNNPFINRIFMKSQAASSANLRVINRNEFSI